MPRTAEVIYVGDAASLIRASEQAKVATESATAGIAASGKKAEASYLSMSGAGKKAASELEHSGGRMGAALAGIGSSGNLAVAGIVGVAVAAEGIKHAADTTSELAAETLKLHNVTGLSIKSASAYASVAKTQELNSRQLNQAFGTLSKNVQAVQNAHDGLTKSAHTQENAFKLLKLPLADIYKAHGDLNKILPDVTAHFERMRPGVEKTAVGMALFGRGWQTLVPLMHSGALGLREQLDVAEKMGATIGGASVKSLKDFKKAQEESKYALLGLNLAIGQYVAPALTKLITGFAHAVEEIRTGSGTIGKAAHIIGAVFTVMWEETAFAWKTTATVIGAFVGAVEAAVGAVKTAVGAIVSAAKGLASGVSGAFNATIDAIKEFFNSFYDAGKYLIEGLVKGIEAGASKVVEAVKSVGEGAKNIAEEVLSIKSPSRVFHRIGLSVSEGFAEGIHAGKGKAHEAVSALMASAGGFSAAPGTNYRVGEEPTLAKRLGELGRALGIRLTGISGYRTPQHSVEVGGFANDPHTRGEASDTEGAQSISEAVLAKFGLTRPFPGAKEANHIQLLAGKVVAKALQTLTGKISWFGGPNDPTDSGHTALGNTTATPGIAVYNHATLGGYWRVHLPNGRTAVLRQTDIGPAPWTGRKIDFTYSALKKLGYSEGTFPTNATASAEYLGMNPTAATRGAAGAGGRAAEPGLTLTPGQAALVALLEGRAGGYHAARSRLEGRSETYGGELETSLARRAARHESLATPEGARQAAMGAGETTSTRKVEAQYIKREIVAVQKEGRAFVKLRDQYLSFARHAHGKAKKEALKKAAAFGAKAETAEHDAQALGGKLYAKETQVIEAEGAAALLPGEQQGADLSAYEAAVGKVDAEVRAGRKTADEGKAAKERIASGALSGAYGPLSEEGVLKVQGDLREFSQALQEATAAQDEHTQALKDATKTLAEFNQASTALAQVESGTALKALADFVSGQIAGTGYHPSVNTPGAGTAARY